MIPIVLLAAWSFQPEIQRVANTAGFITTNQETSTVPAGDD